MGQRSNGLVVKMLNSQSMSPEFKTARWPQGQFNLLPFQGRLSEYQEVLGTNCKLSPQSSSVVVRQLNIIHQKGPYGCFFFLIVHKYNNTRCNPTSQTYSNYEGIIALQIIILRNTLTKKKLQGRVHYIFSSLFLSLEESIHETGENAFYFTSKALFIFAKIEF